MTTRFVHVVRCKAKNSDGTLDDTKYADVQVIDQICLTTDNGGQETFNFTAANAVPTIVDVAADGGGVDNGGAATRQSRLIRITNPNDSTQFFNEEVLDQVCITRDNGGQEIWNFSQVAAFISSTTGPDIDPGNLVDVLDTLVNDQSSASRLIEVDEILPDQTTQPTPQSDGTDYMAIADIQKLCITIDNGGQAIFDFSDGFRDITDTTQYTTDSSGDLVPPDNTDPDPYVVIPESSSGLSTGNALVQQGPLWKIINFSSSARQFIVGGNSFDGMSDTVAASVLLVKDDGSHTVLGNAELDAGGSLPFLDGLGGYAWEDSNFFVYQRFNAKGVLVFTAPNGSDVLSLDRRGNLYYEVVSGTIIRASSLGMPSGTVTGAAIGYTQGSITAVGSNALFVAGLDNTGNNTLAQKLTFDGSPGWGPISITGSPIGCATDGTDMWVLIASVDQTDGSLIKLSGKTGDQLLNIFQSPAPVGLDVDGSGNPIVLLVFSGGIYLYAVKSFSKDGSFNWVYSFGPPGPVAPSEDADGWLPAGARGIGGNSGLPLIAAGSKTIALTYGWQFGPFVPSTLGGFGVRTVQAFTGIITIPAYGVDLATAEAAAAALGPWIGGITIHDNGSFPDSYDGKTGWELYGVIVSDATAYTAGGPPVQVGASAFGIETATILASDLPVYSSVTVVSIGSPVSGQIGIIKTFLTGLDAKTGSVKWQLTGSGVLGIAPDNPNAQPLIGTLPFVPVVNRTGR